MAGHRGNGQVQFSGSGSLGGTIRSQAGVAYMLDKILNFLFGCPCDQADQNELFRCSHATPSLLTSGLSFQVSWRAVANVPEKLVELLPQSIGHGVHLC